jgi:hypothetical protein
VREGKAPFSGCDCRGPFIFLIVVWYATPSWTSRSWRTTRRELDASKASTDANRNRRALKCEGRVHKKRYGRKRREGPTEDGASRAKVEWKSLSHCISGSAAMPTHLPRRQRRRRRTLIN